jgi:large repetitive protein
MKLKMKRCLAEYAVAFTAIICLIIFIGCGGGGSSAPAPAPLSGSVVQGSVSGAIVFADHKTGAEANFKMDPDEAFTATTTAANGTFTLAGVPSYDYISVSQGGIDSITGKPAMQMLAPAGVGIVSPLTTMVTLNPATQGVIAGLGVNYTDDISKSVTPAALLLVQSIQSISTTLNEAMDPAGNILTNDQANAIQRTLLQKIADQVATQTTAQLTNSATLSTTLVTALTNALNTIKADPTNSNITIPNTATLATSVAGTITTTIATAIGSTSTTDKAAEAAIITPAKVTTINTQTDASAVASQANVTATQKPNTPPTISGTPATGVFVNASYSFTPTATDADGNSLTFSIVNKPAWATFNAANGNLSGTPVAANVGTTAGIVISVTDGVATVSLPAFNVTVSPVTGSGGGT